MVVLGHCGLTWLDQESGRLYVGWCVHRAVALKFNFWGRGDISSESCGGHEGCLTRPCQQLGVLHKALPSPSFIVCVQIVRVLSKISSSSALAYPDESLSLIDFGGTQG